MDVEFRPPALGSTVVPIPITGPGTLTIADHGLEVAGAAVAGSGRGALILLVILAVAAVIVALHLLEIDGPLTHGLAAAAGGGLLIPVLRRPAKVGAPVGHAFPWANVKKVTWDGVSECIVVVIKGMKPKGGLYIASPKGSALEAALRERCG